MAEKEYIEREAALKAMDNLLHQNFLNVPDSVTQAAATASYMDGVKDADIRLRSIPAADVRPVVRGKWTKEHLASTSGGTYPVVRCSVCEASLPFFEGTTFCPNCGAEMKQEAK